MTEMIDMSNKHDDRQTVYFFSYGNGFGTIASWGKRGARTTLMRERDGEYEAVDEKWHGYDWQEAMLWVVKWRYYT